MRRLSGFSLSFQKLGFSLAKRENPASPAGAQEGRHQWFPPSDFLPFPKIIWCKPETDDRCEKGERQRIFSFVSFSNYSQCQIPCCYTGGFISAGAAQGELPVCVAVRYLTLRIGCERYGRKNPLPYSFSKRSHIGNLRQIRKQGKGRSSKRKENRRLSFLFAPAAGAATFPPSADGESPPLNLSEKHPAR